MFGCVVKRLAEVLIRNRSGSCSLLLHVSRACELGSLAGSFDIIILLFWENFGGYCKNFADHGWGDDTLKMISRSDFASDVLNVLCNVEDNLTKRRLYLSWRDWNIDVCGNSTAKQIFQTIFCQTSILKQPTNAQFRWDNFFSQKTSSSCIPYCFFFAKPTSEVRTWPNCTVRTQNYKFFDLWTAQYCRYYGEQYELMPTNQIPAV